MNNKKVGFINISRFPHPKAKDIMTINRIVIVPEFQGFGLGIKFINQVADLYKKDNRIRITTSLKPFILAMEKNINWKCVRFGRVSSGSGSIHNKKNVNSFSFNRITATFEYK